MRSVGTVLTGLVISFSLTACGGGGGTGTGPTIPGGPASAGFAGFSKTPATATATLEGSAVTATLDVNAAARRGTLTNVSGPKGATISVTKRNGNVAGLGASAPGASVNVDTRRGGRDDSTSARRIFSRPGSVDRISVLNENTFGYEYQTYGAWTAAAPTGAASVGFGSAGMKTPAAALPRRTASYNGFTAGLMQDASGRIFDTASNARITTDFTTATISSNRTIKVDAFTRSRAPASELDFSGTGPVSGSGFSAPVTAARGTGTADGQFYGPAAEEVGGTFTLRGSGGMTYIGAFGAK